MQLFNTFSGLVLLLQHSWDGESCVGQETDVGVLLAQSPQRGQSSGVQVAHVVDQGGARQRIALRRW